MKDGYKTVDELTPDQLDELKGAIVGEFLDKGRDVPAEYLDGNGDVTDSAVKSHYAGTVFTDDDFTCTAGDLFGDVVNEIEARVA